MKGQTHKHSVIESILNVLIGYGIAIATQLIIFPLFGGHFTVEQNLKIGGLFTMVSLVRSYCLRRIFNLIMVRGQEPLETHDYLRMEFNRIQERLAASKGSLLMDGEPYDPKQEEYKRKRREYRALHPAREYKPLSEEKEKI